MLETDCQLRMLKFTHLRCMIRLICQNYLLFPTDFTKTVYLNTLVELSNNSKTDNWAITKCYIIDYHEITKSCHSLQHVVPVPLMTKL